MALTLEEVIKRVPQWSDSTEMRATPLVGGITNNNFRIDVGGEAFVLRIPGADTELLAINRDYEYEANYTAGVSGIAPEVYYYIQPEGCLITRFIDGCIILPEEIKQPENIQRVMDTVHRVHNMTVIPGKFDVFHIVREYQKTAHRYGVEIPDIYDWLMIKMLEAEKALNILPNEHYPCHNDLLNANFLSSERLYILDWEYAGMGDIFFDLANFSDHHNLTDDQDHWLLKCYFGKDPTPNQWAHLKIMKIMSDLRETTWGLVQIGISKIDFNYYEYANKFLSRVMENIDNPNWNEWLKEVSEKA